MAYRSPALLTQTRFSVPEISMTFHATGTTLSVVPFFLGTRQSVPVPFSPWRTSLGLGFLKGVYMVNSSPTLWIGEGKVSLPTTPCSFFLSKLDDSFLSN